MINLFDNNFETKGSDGLAFLSSLTNCSDLVAVILENGQFGGVLPDSVGNLSTSVYFLVLDKNQLYGSIPSTIGNLVNLEVLGLNYNLFTGSIPGSIASCVLVIKTCIFWGKLHLTPPQLTLISESISLEDHRRPPIKLHRGRLITNAELCIKDRYGYVEAECGVCVVEFVIGRGEQGDDRAGVAAGWAVDPRVVSGEEDDAV
ncbi:hypothetical protein RHGRI_009928 [Rhododendron griersonianum]|uniref:Uncharacterized protein n=1 Tax=Rhododendron griersonianum TaxID=479676 RepID=A0AAV6KHC1_9ERIC|nr:hypothetical protein RHGRI_009928 [Rhododendron griersonianum]